MQPLIILALIGVAAVAMSTGFLSTQFAITAQNLGVAETDLVSPINTATIDLELAKLTDAAHTGVLHTHFHNVIDKCSFHSPTTLGIGSTIICKLTDLDDDVIAEGKIVLVNTYTGSIPGLLIPIQQTAFHQSNDVQEVHDVKIVVLGPKPAPFTNP